MINIITDYIGEVTFNNFNTPMKIIEYLNCSNVVVEFQDEYKFKKKTTYNNFKNGNVKNPYDKSIFGIAYLGNGNHRSWKNSRGSRDTYLNWIAILQRCYVDMNGKYESYYGIAKVCDEWFNFQNFATWYENNYYCVPNEKIHIDKDIKFTGNKIYSPDTCILVPQKINELFHRSLKKTKDIDLPKTITRAKNGFKVEFRGKNIGVYETVNECLKKYNEIKVEYIKELVKEYDEYMPNDVKEILLNWTEN